MALLVELNSIDVANEQYSVLTPAKKKIFTAKTDKVTSSQSANGKQTPGPCPCLNIRVVAGFDKPG